MNTDYFVEKTKSTTKFRKEELFESIKIQTNQVCTRKCKYCYYGVNKENHFPILETKTVYRLLDELSDLNYTGRVGLFEINEPLTDPRIYDFIKYATKHIPNAWHMLITNGDLLTENNLEILNKIGLNQLSISIYDEKTFSKVHKMRTILPEYFNIVDIMDLRKKIFTDNRGGNIKYKYAKMVSKPLRANCERVHKILCVHPTGKVVSCFGDFYEINTLGDVYQNSLKNIWFGEDFKRLRRELDNKNRSFSKLCSKCNYPGMGGFFKKPNLINKPHNK